MRISLLVNDNLHLYPKLIAGPETWTMLGGSMKVLGIDFVPAAWGFMAAFSEFVGGLFLVLGFLTRPACFLLLATMVIATTMHIGKGDPFLKYSHAMESGILFFSLLLIGPGRYSLDGQIHPSRKS